MRDDNAPALWAERLAHLGRRVRQAIEQSRRQGQSLGDVVAHEHGDAIFAIDRHVEPLLDEAIESWPAACKPLLSIAEGKGVISWGTGEPRHRLIVDPIDGTRNLVYDKRSAWFIAAVCEERGEATTLADAFAAAVVELPTSKAGYADTYTATRDRVQGMREPLFGGASPEPVPVGASRATTLLGGFAQVSSFFPGTKVLAAELMQRIVDVTLGPESAGGASVFDDQYITTAGQLVELMTGRDRFCCDLRPLFYRVLELQNPEKPRVRGLECHPYDMAGLLVAQQAGVVLTDGFGAPLAPPLDVHTGVHWCGYANESLRRAIQPVIVEFFAERGVEAS